MLILFPLESKSAPDCSEALFAVFTLLAKNNVSIRAELSLSEALHYYRHCILKVNMFTKCFFQRIISIVLNLTSLIAKAEKHMATSVKERQQWLVGLRKCMRVHPYDGQDIEFSTCCWKTLTADSPAQAAGLIAHLQRAYQVRLFGPAFDLEAVHVFICLTDVQEN